MVYCAGKLIEILKLFYKSIRPHFLWVYRRDNPLAGKSIESVVYCLNNKSNLILEYAFYIQPVTIQCLF